MGSAMNSTNANNFTMIKNAQMESRNFKVMNEMNKTIQPETKTMQEESKATCSSSSTATSSGPSTPSSSSPRPLCRVSSPTTSPSPSPSAEPDSETDVISGTSAASPSAPASSVANGDNQEIVLDLLGRLTNEVSSMSDMYENSFKIMNEITNAAPPLQRREPANSSTFAPAQLCPD